MLLRNPYFSVTFIFDSVHEINILKVFFSDLQASNPGQFENDMELSWQKGHTLDSIFHNVSKIFEILSTIYYEIRQSYLGKIIHKSNKIKHYNSQMFT